MPETKDTVISDEQIKNLEDEGLALPPEAIIFGRDVAKAQAEITYPIAFKEGIEKGRREVVEFVNQFHNAIWYRIPEFHWHAKLKSWNEGDENNGNAEMERQY